jgi:hypothetical protein
MQNLSSSGLTLLFFIFLLLESSTTPPETLLEGLILLPVDQGNYRWVGFFSGCDDLDWFREQEP